MSWMEVCPAAIYSDVDISEVSSFYVPSQWESQTLLQGLVSHELTS